MGTPADLESWNQIEMLIFSGVDGYSAGQTLVVKSASILATLECSAPVKEIG